MPLIQDSDLIDVLMGGDIDDIGILIDLITDKGQGRISLSSEVCRRLTTAYTSRQIEEESRALIAEELKRFGGNSLVNLLRGGAGAPYKEIVCDVASHLKVAYDTTDDCLQIEMAIIAKVFEQSLGKMSEEQRKELFKLFDANYIPGAGPAAMAAIIAAIRLSGFGSYQLTAIVANAAMTAMLGRGLAFGASAGALRGISVLAGPVGWAITAIWTAFDLASPAYRVTVPCVIQITYMRQKALNTRCPICKSVISAGVKYCGECGERLNWPAALLGSD